MEEGAVSTAAAEVVTDNPFVRKTATKPELNFMTKSKNLALTLLISAGISGLASQSASAAGGQLQFDTPKQAVDAVVNAARTFDVPALKQILGPGSDDIVSSKDPVMDKQRALAFAEKAKEREKIIPDPNDANTVHVLVGKDDYPMPVPIVRRDGKWSFDTKAGLQEILYRRIGSNELDAITICHGYVDAQLAYAKTKHDGAKINQYAQVIISTPGKHDGLAWKNKNGSWGGPFGPDIVKALAQGYTSKGQPYHGYYFKVLKGQGPDAPLGKVDYVNQGAMIGGFALAAAPADYRVTGVKTFIISQSGIVYEKDLGRGTLSAFQRMDRYNPDSSWQETDDSW